MIAERKTKMTTKNENDIS